MVKVLTEDPPVKGLSQGQQVVAKLYDPMYMNDDGFYINPFLVADKEYTNETAAYQALSDFQGSKIPRYYGSYSLDIPLPGPLEDKCSVRLTLIEPITGPSMPKGEPCGFSQEARQSIMKSLIEFDTLVYAKYMSLSDLHPRNIMLTDRGTVFIDFGDICFDNSDIPELVTKSFPGMYISPLLRWHQAQDRTYGFENWIDWDWQHWLEAEFGHTAATIKPEMQERFLPSFLLNRSNSPPPLF